MQKNLFYTLVLICSVSLIFFAKAEARGNQQVIAKKIENGKLFITQFDLTREQSIDISDLIIISRIEKKRDIFNTFYENPVNYRKLLLEKGYAKLKKETSAEVFEVNAQNKARTKKIEIWSEKKSGTVPKSFNWKVLWEYVTALVGFGIIGWGLKQAYNKFYIQRKCKLLIIGEPSAGKSALFLNIIDPNVSRNKILKLTPSSTIESEKKNKVIPKGKFEFIPELSNVPGSAFASVWDNFFGVHSHVLVVVISPLRLNSMNNGEVDQKYVDIQLGYVQAYIEGGIGAK